MLLAGATSPSPAVALPSPPSAPASSSIDSGSASGIIIGVVVGLALLLYGGSYLFTRKSKKVSIASGSHSEDFAPFG